ncbi:MAG TPA: FAD-binding oxidoreductase [Rhodospirillales bacterium]|nr:FAD-binding oxidoreductase [Rhodospirillales bacterium]
MKNTDGDMFGMFDVAVIGGGVMGCATALHLARGGMRVALVERGGLCTEASGRNAGTLTPMFPAPFLVPYAQRGMEMWQTAPEWLGRGIGYQARGGLELAFTEAEVAGLESEMGERAQAGAPIQIMDIDEARRIEPSVSAAAQRAAYCPIDGFVESNAGGRAFRAALLGDGVTVLDRTQVRLIERRVGGFTVGTAAGDLNAGRVVLAAGAWIPKMAAWLGLDLPITVRIHQMVVTERLAPLLRVVVRIFGRGSFKQAVNGSMLLGTVLHWISDADREADEIDRVALIRRMTWAARNGCEAIPALAGARLLRTWTGLEAYAPDNLPVIGPLPGMDDAFIIGCQRSGFTCGPFMGQLLADLILGRQPELPIAHPVFDPRRLLAMRPDETSAAARALS